MVRTLSPAERILQKSMRISRGCSMEEFARVCTVCVERGILGGFFEEEPPMVNGTFGVGKPDGRIRLIVDLSLIHI
eukprot:9295948-Alexandrium_andersonii.AAC.1